MAGVSTPIKRLGMAWMSSITCCLRRASEKSLLDVYGLNKLIKRLLDDGFMARGAGFEPARPLLTTGLAGLG